MTQAPHPSPCPPQPPAVSPKFRFRRIEAIGAVALALIVMLAAVGYIEPEEGSGRQLIARIFIIFVALVVGFRLIGKRELSQMSPFEMVTLLIIAEIVSPSLTAGDESIPGAIIGAATLLFLTFVNSVMFYHWTWYQKLCEAPPAVVICNGRFIEPTLHKDRLRTDEILSEMHKSGIERLEEVKWGLLEPDGQISFIRHDHSSTDTNAKTLLA